jgi:hypothetical protein
MTTPRKPAVRRRDDPPIPVDAVEIYLDMCGLECEAPETCHGVRCESCCEWWRNHTKLHDALRLKPWQWPAIASPGNAPHERQQALEMRLRELAAAMGTQVIELNAEQWALVHRLATPIPRPDREKYFERVREILEAVTGTINTGTVAQAAATAQRELLGVPAVMGRE